jgi:tyrosine-protein kinase shark
MTSLSFSFNKIKYTFLHIESKKTNNTDLGIFLVRESSTLLNNYVLSVIYREEFYHYQIQQHGEDAFFSIDSTSIHHGLDDMIEHYRHFDSNLCVKLEKFVKKNSPPTKYCRLGKANLLHRATKHNNLNVVKELLTSSFRNLDAKDELGMTAVHLASVNNVNPEIMKLLIDKGAQVQCRDSEGNTSLHVKQFFF